MSLTYKHFDMVLEVTNDGDLLFPEYNLEYDQAFAAMGGDRSPALCFLDDWYRDPTAVFFAFGLGQVTQAELLRVGRALVETIVSLAGVVNIHGTNFEAMGQEIYEAGRLSLPLADHEPLDKVRDKLGWIGAGLQQQKWMHGGSGTSWYFDHRVDPQRAVVDAATTYVHMINKMHGVEAYWERLGRQRAVNEAYQVVQGSLYELTASQKQEQADSWHPGKLPIPGDFVPAAKKICVGAIIRTLGGSR